MAMSPIKTLAPGSRIFSVVTESEGKVTWIDKDNHQVGVMFSRGVSRGLGNVVTFDDLKNRRKWLKIE